MWAKGTHARAICDRCGFAFPYRSIREEPGTGWRVCSTCNDGQYSAVAHPQNRPPRVTADAEALEHARSDVSISPY